MNNNHKVKYLHNNKQKKNQKQKNNHNQKNLKMMNKIYNKEKDLKDKE